MIFMAEVIELPLPIRMLSLVASVVDRAWRH